ncbi:galactokinase [Petrocella atlantisensis]|uniref:Galactokinase n=1 Tax=Petrocella atlantisensis TaxID=2173034 RepID=A0A3P7S4X9_9FIRM|nr:galactokinase [Petrocella atlantisensis]VDN47539.1 galactokinase [Petrocella atlantisensis]
MNSSMKISMKASFESIYGEGGEIRYYFAPGRVNLIGEHIDYNGGFVFPCALGFGTYAAVRLRDDDKVSFATMNFDTRVTVDLDHILYKEEDSWTNYPKGVIKTFLDLGISLKGFEVLYYGNIPNGAGLSSSASLEVLTAVMINDLFECDLDRVDLVKMSQKAENDFVGVNCGIMDQFAVGMGKANHAILLDCNTLKYEYVPLKLEGVKIIISNTNMRRGLADSKYNERRRECDKAVADLNKDLDIRYLCDLDGETFENNKHLIEDQVVRNRAEHAVYENLRTLEAKEALEKGDLSRFGVLMNKSHDSLRDLYEVTGDALDTMVNEARKIDGTIGSRMTGAGFGGCTVSLVKEEAVEQFIEKVGKDYETLTGLTPAFYVAGVGQGASRI